MQYNISINDEKQYIQLDKLKRIDYQYNKTENTKQINDILTVNLENCNLDFSDKIILIVGNDKLILHYIKKLLFKQIIMTLDINNIQFNNIVCIINITNDIKISQLLSTKSFQYNIPLFDYNIDNYKMKIHTIIPFITDYSPIESLYQDKSYLLCVLTNFPTEYDHTIKWAIDNFDKLKCTMDINTFANNIFNEYYNIGITKLLDTIEDEIWANKCNKPTPIIFDSTNLNHTNFISQTIKIFSQTNKNEYNKTNNDYLLWLLYASKLRCNNYNISEPTIDDVKYSCGIVKTPQESLEIVYNLIIVQVIKYFNNYNLHNNYKNTFIDIINLTIDHHISIPAKEIIINNIKMNNWVKLSYTENTTLKEFKEYYEKYFNTNISMILCDSKMLYVEFMQCDTSKKILEIISNNSLITMMTDNDEELHEIQIQI